MPEHINRSAFEDLRAMTGTDFLGEMIDTFLDDAPQQIQTMQTALSAGDVDAFRRAAHSLKSNAASFGADQLAELAYELELLGRQNQLADVGTRLDILEKAYQFAAVKLKELRP